jgi:hypothetical protein
MEEEEQHSLTKPSITKKALIRCLISTKENHGLRGPRCVILNESQKIIATLLTLEVIKKDLVLEL